MINYKNLAESLCIMTRELTGEDLYISRIDSQWNLDSREFITYIYLNKVGQNKAAYIYRAKDNGKIYSIGDWEVKE